MSKLQADIMKYSRSADIVTAIFLSILILFSFAVSADPASEPYNYAMQLGYKDQGQASLRDYQKGTVSESIDPYTGALKLTFVDAYINLNGGLSFPILRTYTNLQNNALGLSGYRSPNVSAIGGRGVMGEGWDLHFGRVWIYEFNQLTDTNCQVPNLVGKTGPVLELPDGSRKTFYNSALASNELITADFWRAQCLPIDSMYSPNGGLLVYSPDGKVYHFNQLAQITPGDSSDNQTHSNIWAYEVTEIDNKSRDASVAFDYNWAGNYLVLTQIRTSDGETISFNYVNADVSWGTRLDSIARSGGGSVSYQYSDYSGTYFTAQPTHLMSATIDGLGSWAYGYSDSLPTSGEGQYSLSSTTSPEGVQTSYVYGYNSLSSATGASSDPTLGRVVVTHKTMYNSGTGGGPTSGDNWDFNYALTTDGANLDITQVIHQGYGCTAYIHQGDHSIPVNNGANDDIVKMGLLVDKADYSSTDCSGTPLREEVYQWDTMDINVPTVSGGTTPPYQQSFRPNPYTESLSGIKRPVLVHLTTKLDGGNTTFDVVNSSFNVVGEPMQILEYQEGSGVSGIPLNNRSKTIQFANTTTDLSTASIDTYWRLFQPQNEFTCTGNTTCNSSNAISWATRDFYSNGLIRNENKDGANTYFVWFSDGNPDVVETSTGDDRVSIFKYYAGYSHGIPQIVVETTGADFVNRVYDTDGRLSSGNFSVPAPSGLRQINQTLDGRGDVLTTNIQGFGIALVGGTWQVTSSMPISWSYTYDNVNRMTSASSSLSGTYYNTSISYQDGDGMTITATQGQLVKVKHYDGNGGLVYSYVEDAAGAGQNMICTSYINDDLERVVFQTAPYYASGSACANISTIASYAGTKKSYDEINRVTFAWDALNDSGSVNSSKIQYSYLSGNVTRVVDENMNTTDYYSYSYGKPEGGFLVKIDAPEGQATVIRRNEVGRISEVDQGSITHAYSYDDVDHLPFNLLSESSPEENVSYTRSLLGDALTKTAGGVTTSYKYDYQNQIVNIQSPTYNISQINNLVNPSLIDNRTSGNGGFSSQHDAFGYINSEYSTDAGADSGTITYIRTPNGYVSSATYTAMSQSAQICYYPDNLGRPTKLVQLPSGTSVCDGSSGTALASNVSYYPDGAVQGYDQGNGAHVAFTETARQLPKDIIMTISGGGTTIAGLTYQYDLVKNITGITDAVDTTANKGGFSYDGLNRLKTVTGPWGQDQYTYFANGNLNTLINTVSGGSPSTTQYTYDTGTNRLSAMNVAGTSYSYGYDNLGNVNQNGNNHFVFDDLSRLTQILDSTNSQSLATYGYDEYNRRRNTTDQNGTHRDFYSMESGKLMLSLDTSTSGSQSRYFYLANRLVTRSDLCLKGEVDSLGVCHKLDRDGDGVPDWVDIAPDDASIACAVGSYYNGTACTPASSGYYVPDQHSLAQTACAIGDYQPSTGQTSCLSADAGYYVGNTGSGSETTCPANTQSNAGQSKCCHFGYSLRSSGSCYLSAANDFNGDGSSDVVFIDTAADSALLWPSAIDNTYFVASYNNAYVYVASADFDGDGQADALFYNPSNHNTIIWPSGYGGGTIIYPGVGPGTNYSVVDVCDFDGDGKADVLWRSTSGAVTIWPGSASDATKPYLDKTAAYYPGTMTYNAVSFSCGDFDGDGYQDVLLQNPNSPFGLAVWPGSPSGPVKANAYYPGSFGMTTYWTVFGVGDFNGDGYADVLLFNTNNKTTQIWPGSSSGVIKANATSPGTADSGYQLSAIGDYDGDGKADIFWSNLGTLTTEIWPGISSSPYVSKASVTYPGSFSANYVPVK